MKFDQVEKVDRGLKIILRDEHGVIWGAAQCYFISGSRAPFSRSHFNGTLEMSAIVFNMNATPSTPDELKKIQVLAARDNTCRGRQEADRHFRNWIKQNRIRELMIEQAIKMRSKWLEYQACPD